MRRSALALPLLLLLAGPAAGQGAAEPPRAEETPEVLPPGEHREETFYYCTACHSTAIIRRTGLDRERWDALMDWMTEVHGMAPLEGEFREQIVGYLAGAFPPRRRPRAANPFLN